MQETGEYTANLDHERKALASLKNNPLSRSSLRIIAMNADAAQNIPRARAAMALSSRTSRRDTLAQIWLLEKAAEQNDFDALLTHYDAAVTVTPELASVIHPILVATLEYDAARSALTPYIRRGARWMPSFLNIASRDAAVGDLVDLLSNTSAFVGEEALRQSINRILYRAAADGNWERVQSLMGAIWGDFDNTKFSITEPRVENSDNRYGALSWSLTSNGEIRTEIQKTNPGILITLQPLARGVVAARTLPVESPNTYTLTQRVDYKGASGTRVNWVADCILPVTNERQRIWEQTIPPARQPVTYRSEIEIPSNCYLMDLRLFGTGPEGQLPQTLSITDIALKRLKL